MKPYSERAAHAWTEDSVRIIATPSVTAKSTFYYVQEVGWFRTRPPYFTERENLNSYLVVCTLAGKGYLHYKGKWYTLGANQVFFIDCMEYQFYKTDEHELWEMVWVHFNGSGSRGYYEQFMKNGSPVVTFEKGCDTVASIIRQLIDIHRQKDVRTEPLSSFLLVHLLTELLLAANAPSHSAGLFLPSYLEQILRDLDKRFHEKISLDQLAKRHAVSKFHLVREFKKYTGFTPNEYLINRRITYAKELLIYSDLTVSAIASRVGIDNVSHFINLFKDRVEMTPLAFRKKWQRPRQEADR
ncbi:AraC family transcriptional regulator [Brevibacillus sp. SYP-B805]|uniref:AraC family transcriptional regulator n=1 Tax=Brevibacillus sp. SYP-B805 TaxID=1578199 RepID=UPI0013EDC25E|nr:AraC family transcriptional regulator [Brevibacillus sp. SYP-B805]NGQ96716.1 AraC family transcriptional regulator [Brevibacillus sp. SYP-B805]